MAQRRMFTKEITTSDAFVDMPASSQLLYFHLGMEADDEGFIGNARMLSRAYGTSTDDLRLLIAKGFIIAFDSGVTVVKDWNLNNKIRKDRSKPTIYLEEKNQLVLDTTGAYQHVNQLATNWQPKTAENVDISDDNQMSTKCQPNVRIGKDRLGKDMLGNSASFDAGNTHHKKNSSTLTAVEKSDFEKLWALYPNKKGKEVASKAYLKAIRSGVTNKQIQSGIVMYKKEIEYKGTEKAFIKHGSTWFNQAGWEDEYEIGSSNSQMNVDTTAEIDNLKIQLNQTDISAAQRQALERRIERLEKDVS